MKMLRNIVLRTLIMTMILINVMSERSFASEEIIEGSGYASAEDAVTAYLKALQENDIEQMLATFAVETFVDNYDIAKNVDYFRAFLPTIGYIPNISKYSRELNIEQRRSDLTSQIRKQYLTLTGSETVFDKAGKPIPLEEGVTAQDLLNDIFATDDQETLNNIEIGEFVAPETVFKNYYDEVNQNNIAKRADSYGAEEIKVVYIWLLVGGTDCLMCMDTVCYSGAWYNLALQGFGASFLGVTVDNAGTLVAPTP